MKSSIQNTNKITLLLWPSGFSETLKSTVSTVLNANEHV